MSTETTPPLSLLHVDFDELYTRHLGRHSQFGINVAHLIALYGIWFGIYAIVKQAVLHLGLPVAWPIILAMATTYFVTVAINAPFRVCLATAVFLAFFVASVLSLPKLPIWSILVFLLPDPGLLQDSGVEPQDLERRGGYGGVQQAIPAGPCAFFHSVD